MQKGRFETQIEARKGDRGSVRRNLSASGPESSVRVVGWQYRGYSSILPTIEHLEKFLIDAMVNEMIAYRRANFRPDHLPYVCEQYGLQEKLASVRHGNVDWRDTLSLSSGKRVSYVRGISHFNPLERRNLERATLIAMESTEMNKWYDHVIVREGLLGSLEEFYHGCSDALCLVIYENLRELFAKRCEDFSKEGFKIEQKPLVNPMIDDSYDTPYRTFRHRPASINCFHVDLYRLPLQLPEDSVANDVYLRGYGYRRTFSTVSGERSIGFWDHWSLARKGEDDQAMLVGKYATRVSGLLEDALNPSCILTWMKIDIANGRSYSVCFDFDPVTGCLISIRNVEMSLHDYLLMDPRLDHWLIQAGHRQLYFGDYDDTYQKRYGSQS